MSLQKLIVFLPLISALCALTAFISFGRLSQKAKHITDIFCKSITTTFVVFAALLSIKLLASSLIHGSEVVTVDLVAKWMSTGGLNLDWAIRVDRLTLIMFVVVTFVSSLVHIYSLGYMHDDENSGRFMAYLSLFTFFMLMLVSSSNFIQLFFGWEGVGLASYLLIGFWFKKSSANAASIKAFVTNRVGDFGLILGIACIYFTFGSLDYSVVFSSVENHLLDKIRIGGVQISNIDLICLLLFVGAMGKSAQLGLHTWLADAMEGPTPVSALIHAATMVTAGVFLVARCSPIFEHSEIALATVAIVGALTAVFAGTIAITQNDIKRIIAYSTCSQLGYMFFACGVSAYNVAIFHLATHAFFKALLFLSAGSVIYALHHEQDIQKMGGVRKYLPLTHAMFWIGSLALAGIPPLSGFFSKDLILETALAKGTTIGHFCYFMGVLAAIFTTLYSFRLIFIVFFGKETHAPDAHHHPHEPPAVMTIPLIILAIGSVFVGGVFAKLFHITSPEFFSKSIFLLPHNQDLVERAHHLSALAKFGPLAAVFVAFGLSYILFLKRRSISKKIASCLPLFYKISHNKWYFDEIYDVVFVKSANKIGSFFWKITDVNLIDRFGPNGVGKFFATASSSFSKIQTGRVNGYASAIVIGSCAIICYLILSI